MYICSNISLVSSRFVLKDLNKTLRLYGFLRFSESTFILVRTICFNLFEEDCSRVGCRFKDVNPKHAREFAKFKHIILKYFSLHIQSNFRCSEGSTHFYALKVNFSFSVGR